MLKAMIDLKGSYSLVIMTENKLYAVRDPYGNRPLCLGKIGEDGYVVASESCALDAIGATFLRDVEPGEILTIDENGLHSTKLFNHEKNALCIFEFIYIARPDSNIDGINVNKARRLMGRELAKDCLLYTSYFNEKHGMFLCIGWGRCVAKCPVNLDITKFIQQVIGQ